MPPCGHAGTVAGCHLCHLFATDARYRRLWGGAGPVAPARGRCLWLGPRVEFRVGCSGWLCRHRCEAGEPAAVPGGGCQSCPKWEAEA